MATGQHSPKWMVPTRWWLFLGLGCITVVSFLLWLPSSNRNQIAQATPVEMPETASPQPAAFTRIEASPKPPSLNLDPATARLIKELSDPTRPLKARRQQAREWARLGTEHAIPSLQATLQADLPPYVKAAIGEGLGENPHPEAMPLLLEMTRDSDETAARGAIRGLALRGDADSAHALENVLFNEHLAESVRSEAALALGDISQPAALATLTRAASEWPEQPLTESVLEGLGKRPFSETEEFFRSYFASPSLSSESKVTAVEALGNSFGQAQSLLLNLAGDPDPEIRAAAAWSLISSSDSDLSAPLISLLQQEPVPSVRSRLYEALANQDGADISAVLGLVQKESDPQARIRALAALATTFHSTPSTEALAYFNDTAVPELKQTALTDQSAQNRLSSVTVLAQARTPGSTAALTEISGESHDARVIAAAQAGLQRPIIASR